jgi:peptidoglycan L-alanyl-D-glutamate endopeptidase CwlK
MSKETDNEFFVRTVQGRLGLAQDGWAGRKTLDALDAVLKPTVTFAAVGQVDERSEKNILTLNPQIQEKARQFVREAVSRGFKVKIISGTRTYAEQDALYAQGRTKSGNIVTKAPAGFSNHNFGVAFDIGLFDENGKYLEDSPQYLSIAPIAKSLGFSWGGDWTSMKDYPHYEWPTGMTLAQMRQRVADGRGVLA